MVAMRGPLRCFFLVFDKLLMSLMHYFYFSRNTNGNWSGAALAHGHGAIEFEEPQGNGHV